MGQLNVERKTVDEDVIEIFTTEMVVTAGGRSLEGRSVGLNGEEGDIGGTTTEIEDEKTEDLP